MNSEYVMILGVVSSLFTTELLGLSPGGVICPGYLALYIDAPLRVAVTLGDALITLLVVRGLGRLVPLFGRRRYAAFILSGFLVRFVTEHSFSLLFPEGPALSAIGWLIPGLIASDADRQGPARTVAALIAVALFVRLVWMAFA